MQSDDQTTTWMILQAFIKAHMVGFIGFYLFASLHFRGLFYYAVPGRAPPSQPASSSFMVFELRCMPLHDFQAVMLIACMCQPPQPSALIDEQNMSDPK